MDNLQKARLVAIKAHGNQKYGDKPYEYHLEKVIAVLKKFGFDESNQEDENLLISAWLHDSLEDTALTKAEIENDFGSEVAELVWRVTDEEGKNRKERKEKTYPKIRQSENAIILKLADRIANVEAGLDGKKDLLKMYQKEQTAFAEQLKPFSHNERAFRMWEYLEEKLNNE